MAQDKGLKYTVRKIINESFMAENVSLKIQLGTPKSFFGFFRGYVLGVLSATSCVKRVGEPM